MLVTILFVKHMTSAQKNEIIVQNRSDTDLFQLNNDIYKIAYYTSMKTTELHSGSIVVYN